MFRLKTVTYGAMHLAVAMGVAYAVTQSWAAALGVGLVEPLVQTVFYVLHEKAWSGGRRDAPRSGPVRIHGGSVATGIAAASPSLAATAPSASPGRAPSIRGSAAM